MPAITNHQIRTPLTVLQANLELMEDALDELPERARRAYQRRAEQ